MGPPLSLPTLPLSLLTPQLWLTLSMPPPPTLRPRSPTLTSTELLMTTPRLTSTLLRPLMLPVLSLDPTMCPSLTAVSSMSSTPLTTTTDMSLMCPTKEPQSTLRPSPMPLLLLPQPTMPKPSVCFVNIYTIYCQQINKT